MLCLDALVVWYASAQATITLADLRAAGVSAWKVRSFKEFAGPRGRRDGLRTQSPNAALQVGVGNGSHYLDGVLQGSWCIRV